MAIEGKKTLFSYLFCFSMCEKFLSGKLVEYDEPMKLMKEENSLFGQLVKEYWSHSHSAEH